MARVGTISEIWRFPVKSMAGESLVEAEATELGVVGDRLWAVRDEEKGCITGGKRLPALMMCRARFLAPPRAGAVDGEVPPVAIHLPDGSELRSDEPDVHARLSAFLGRKVSLCARRPAEDRAHYRAPRPTMADMRLQFGLGPDDPVPDFSMFPASVLIELARFATPPGTYFDAYPLHVLTTASVAELARRAPSVDVRSGRFRPNLLVDAGADGGFAEVAWCGGALRVGSLAGPVAIPAVRCSMTTRAQPGVPADAGVLRALIDHSQRCIGVYAGVDVPGRFRVGDPVEVEVPRTTRVGGWMKTSARSLRRLALRATAAVLPKE